MKKHLFFALAGTAFALLFGLSACDTFNLPVKEKVDFYRAMTPATGWDALKHLVEDSDAELIALTESFSIPAGSAAIQVRRPLTIAAVPGGRAVITRSAGFTLAFFEIREGGALTLGHASGGTPVLDGNKAAFSSGVSSSLIELNEGGASLVLTDAVLRNNKKEGYGGSALAVAITSGEVRITMYGGSIEGNEADDGGSPGSGKGDGGGISLSASGTGTVSFAMYGGSIKDNTAISGGGVYLSSGSGSAAFTLYDGTISGNTASGLGGGVCDDRKGFTMRGGTIRRNHASGGGGVSSYQGFTMYNGIIEMNEADYGGGVDGTDFTLYNGIICKNTALAGSGGGVSATRLYMYGGVISENTASGNGGGVYAAGDSTIDGGTISGNKAGENGGGVYFVPSSSPESILTFSGGTISGNKADADGGGIGLFSGYAIATLVMTGGTIAGNRAAEKGGGVYGDGSYSASKIIKAPGGGGSASGIIYGNSGNANRNGFADASGNPAEGKGYAVYMAVYPPDPLSDKIRDLTVGEGVSLSSEEAGGWL